MKRHIIMPLICSFTLVACSMSQEEGAQNAQSSEEESSENEAINAFLTDVIESAYDDNGSESVDDSVKDDLKEERLQKMAEKIMSEFDADASASLSLAEFLAMPEKFMGSKGASLPAEAHAKIKEKLTEDFNKNAGDDAQLSIDELKILLASCAPRVGGHRGKGPKKDKDHGPGEPKQEPAPTPDASWEEVLKKFDKDGDGKLNKEEFDAFLAEKKSQHGNKGPRGQGQKQPVDPRP